MPASQKVVYHSDPAPDLAPCRPSDHWTNLLAVAAVALSAFVLTYLCGRRGFFASDQSIVFDGGYRVAGGQVIYRDFVAPCGPLVFWIQGLVFKIFGVSYRIYILTAAAFDAAAAVGVYMLVRRLCRPTSAWAMGAMLVAATWFYAISGTPFMENTGFAFVLAALLIAVPRDFPAAPQRVGLPSFLAGILVVAVFLCKQNVGMLAGPVVFIALLLTRVSSFAAVAGCAAAYAAGIVAAAAGVLAWLVACSNLTNFIKFFFVVPGMQGGSRMSWVLHFWLRHGPAAALGGGFSDSMQVLLGLCAAVLLLTIVIAFFKRGDRSWRPNAIASIICLGLMFLQSTFALTTNNKPLNALPFLGTLVAVAGANAYRLMQEAWAARKRSNNVRRVPLTLRVLFAAVSTLLMLALAGEGAYHAITRPMQNYEADAQFEAAAPGLVVGEFLWPRIDKNEKYQVRREDCDQVIRLVRSQPGNMFVLGGWKVLYAASGRPSIDPLLWYHRGLSYSAEYDADLDGWMTKILREKNVSIVIVERSDVLTHGGFTVDDFQQFKTYLQSHYRSHMIGLFEVYVRQDHDQPS